MILSRFAAGCYPSKVSRHHLLASAEKFAVLTENNLLRRGIVFHPRNEKPPRIVGYYVVLPDHPDQTVANNKFLTSIAANSDWPTLNTCTPKEIYEGTLRMIMEYGATVGEHLERLKMLSDEELSFETVVQPLLDEEWEINYAFNTLMLRMLTNWPTSSNFEFNSDMHNIRAILNKNIMEKISAIEYRKALKKIMAKQRDELNEWQWRLIEYHLLEGKANAIHFDDEKSQKIATSWIRFLYQYKYKYLKCIMLTHEKSIYTIKDRKHLEDAPPHVLKALSSDPCRYNDGPWRVRLIPSSIFPFLQYCTNGSLRQEVWEKWISRASFQHNNYNNSINIEEIRHSNEGLAKMLGYSSVSDHHLANKMAGSPETVRDFLTTLRSRMRPVYLDRMESWSSYAMQKDSILGQLQSADLFYICRKEAETFFGLDPLDVMNHFPFWQTFNRLINIMSEIFNLRFEDVTEGISERCHHTARIYSVVDLTTGRHCGRLYVDPFDREGKRGHWSTLLGREQSVGRSLDKIVYLIGAANAQESDPVTKLHYQELQQLLFHTGRAMQFLLSCAPYNDLLIPWAPMQASDWDAADMFPVYVQMFAFKPNILVHLASKHLKSEEPFTLRQAEAFCHAVSRGILWESYRTLFWADFDHTLFEIEDRRNIFWLDLYREMYKDYFPLKLLRYDFHPCSFTSIMGNPNSMGMYYRKLWVEMLALDIHEAFDHEEDTRLTGERLKVTLLMGGSSDVQSEIYRRFRGRDPSIGPLLDFYDPPIYFEREEESRCILKLK